MVRTFPEIQQPKSAFILDIIQIGQDASNSIGCSMSESRSSTWKKDATDSIREYVKAELPDIRVM